MSAPATRRELFGASAAILLLAAPAAGAAKAQELDSTLLAECADYQALHVAIRQHMENTPRGGSAADDDAMDALTIRQCDVMDWIIACDPPRTLEGLRALAAVAYQDIYFSAKPFKNETLEEQASMSQLLALAVLREVAGGARLFNATFWRVVLGG